MVGDSAGMPTTRWYGRSSEDICRYCPRRAADAAGAAGTKHRADAPARDRQADAAILREATVASMVANDQAQGNKKWAHTPHHCIL